MQTRRHSVLEVTLNLVTGFLVALLLGRVLYPLFHLKVTFADNFWLTVIFTAVSFIRSYIFRRVFNWLTYRTMQ